MSQSIMQKIKKSFGLSLEKKAIGLDDSAFNSVFGYRETIAGANVNARSALNVPSVFHAVRLISESCGSLPVKAYVVTDGSKEPAKSHPAYKIAHNRANEWTSANQFRVQLTLDALMYGGGYARVDRFLDGRPFELHRLDPQKVEVLADSRTGAPVYRVQEESGKTDYGFTDILHLSAFGGTSPITLGKEPIGIAMVLERHTANLFAAGARPGVMLHNDKLTPNNPAGENTIRNLKAGYAAATASGFKQPFIADDGWKVAQLSFSSTDSQFLEHRLEQINEIARIFGIPPHMLYQLDRATWSNAEQMAASFLQLCLRPWLDRWQDAYNTVLFSEDERDTHYCEFIIDDLQRADSMARAEIFSKSIAARYMTPNEARAAMNMPKLPGGDELANPFITTTTGAADAPAKG